MPVELHAASAFSFLRGSSLPEDLVERAAELGYAALALVDRDGLAGAPRFFKAAKAPRLRPIVGAELSLDGGGVLPLLVETQRGYRNLCRLDHADEGGVPKGEGRLRFAMLEGLEAGSWPCRGSRRSAGRRAARSTPTGWRAIVEAFGPRPRLPRRAAPPAAGAGSREPGAPRPGRRARACGPWPRTACATRRRRGRALLDVLTCIREKRTLATAGRLLARTPSAT